MSIQDEINRIESNVEDAYQSARSMGASMPPEQNSNNLPAAILSIPQEGGSGGDCSCEGSGSIVKHNYPIHWDSYHMDENDPNASYVVGYIYNEEIEDFERSENYLFARTYMSEERTVEISGATPLDAGEDVIEILIGTMASLLTFGFPMTLSVALSNEGGVVLTGEFVHYCLNILVLLESRGLDMEPYWRAIVSLFVEGISFYCTSDSIEEVNHDE